MALIHFFNWLVLGPTNKDPKFENHGIVAWPTCAMTNNIESTIVLMYCIVKIVVCWIIDLMLDEN